MGILWSGRTVVVGLSALISAGALSGSQADAQLPSSVEAIGSVEHSARDNTIRSSAQQSSVSLSVRDSSLLYIVKEKPDRAG